MNKTLLAVFAAVSLIAGLSVPAAEDGDKEILYWVAPMDPNYRRDEPGKSPMGMDLIPVYADAGGDGSDVTISPAVMQNLGVRGEAVEIGTLSRLIDTVGYIDYDESRVSHVHPRVSGWIEGLRVKSAGERAKKGQVLFRLYSPELVNAQQEFLRALNSGNKGLVGASRDRLRALGIGPGAIARLRKTRKARQTIAIHATQDGVVSELKVREGMYIKPEMNVMTLADLSSVWLIAEVFERQADWVHTGDQAEVRLPFLPGKAWRGRVEYIYPSLNAKTHTLQARLRFDNPDETLRPNMYARVKLFASPRENVLSIPLEALIRAGDKDRVIVDLGEGRFDAREVVAGIESGDRVEIVKGLADGDRVVVSGQFLIDSEASLKASFTRMSDAETDGAEDMAPAAETASGSGKVLGIDPAKGEIMLAHEPIASLGWPAMEMRFRLDKQVNASDFKAGDRVAFDLEKVADGYCVVSLRHADAGDQP